MSEIETAPSGRTGEACLPAALNKPRLRRWEAADYLRLAHGIELKPATLAKWATIGGGPGYQLAGRVPLYPIVELDRWAGERLGGVVRSSSETGAAA